MAWYLCTVSSREPENWDKAKEVGLWGVPGSSNVARKVKKGDQLLFWRGQKGYIAFGVVTAAGRVPNGREDVPWPGGLGRWTFVIPIHIHVEINEPIWLKFARSLQAETGFAQSKFQRGLSLVDDTAAQMIAKRILERSFDEYEA